jgi:hypothetical protein
VACRWNLCFGPEDEGNGYSLFSFFFWRFFTASGLMMQQCTYRNYLFLSFSEIAEIGLLTALSGKVAQAALVGFSSEGHLLTKAISDPLHQPSMT